MEDGCVENEPACHAFRGSSDTLLSIQLLEFKTSLLEAVEELRLRRDAQIQYEEHTSQIMMEKQELEWKNDSLEQQSESLKKQHTESVTALKKQLQAKICAMEEEKGQYKLAAETKEKEITGLKDDLKALQISKYTLQKKLNEMEQKVQLTMSAKEDNLKQLSEVEKCYATFTRQFGMVEAVQEKLEQNVREAVQHNQKLNIVNKQRENEIHQLKQELKKVTADLIRSKVTCQKTLGTENIHLIEKEQQLRELQQTLQMEQEINKKLNEELVKLNEEKEEIISSLQSLQGLLQRQTDTIAKTELEFQTLKTDYEILERDNELQTEKAKEAEEKILRLQYEHENALVTWKKDEELLKENVAGIKTELISIKDAYDQLQESHRKLSSTLLKDVDQCRDIKCQNNVNGLGSGRQEQGWASAKKEHKIIGPEEISRQNFDFSHPQAEHSMKAIDSQVLENGCKDPKNISIVSPELSLEEATETKSVQTEGFSYHSDLSLDVSTEKCNKTASDELTEKVHLKKHNHGAELEGPSSPCLLATFQGKTVNMLDDGSVHMEEDEQEEEFRKHAIGSVTSKLNYNKNDKVVTVQNSKDFFTPTNKECIFPPGTEKDTMTMNTSHTSPEEAESNPANLSQATNIPLTETQICIDDCFDEGNKHSKTEQVHVLNEADKALISDDICQRENSSKVIEDGSHENYSDTMIKDAPQSNPLGCELDVNAGAEREKDFNYADSMCPTFSTENLSHAQMYTQSFAIKTQLNEAFKERTSQCSPEDTEHEQILIVQDVHSTPLTRANKRTSWDRGLQSIDAHFNATKKSNIDIPTLPEKEYYANVGQLSEKKPEAAPVKEGNGVKESTLNKSNETQIYECDTVLQRRYMDGLMDKSYSLQLDQFGKSGKGSEGSALNLKTPYKKSENDAIYFDFSELITLPKGNQVKCQTVTGSKTNLSLFLKEKLSNVPENKKMCSYSPPERESVNVETKEKGPDSPTAKCYAETLTTSSFHPGSKKDYSGEWNAIRQIFYDSSFPKEHATSEIAGQQQISSTDISSCAPGLTCTDSNEITNPVHQFSCRPEHLKSSETLFDEDTDSPPSNIHAQIKEIETFLSMQSLKRTRKRRSEETQSKSFDAAI
ncbi:coiled-coil domain-containing protein 73 [Lissotriton helveticus]